MGIIMIASSSQTGVNLSSSDKLYTAKPFCVTKEITMKRVAQKKEKVEPKVSRILA
jgi:hypothetical protein